jgi:hypothetical protein
MDPAPPPSQEFLLNAFCANCGYDLRSNNAVGPCPKCGTGIPYATFISGLANANPLWVHRIYLGISGILLAQLMLAIHRVLQLAILIAIPDYPTFFWTRFEEEPWSAPRKLLLWVGAASVVMHLARPFLDFVSRGPVFSPSQLLFHLVWIIDLAGVIVLFLYILRLGQRAGDPVLTRHLPLVATLVIVNGALFVIVRLRELPLGRLQGATVAVLVQTAVAVYAVWILNVMRRSLAAVLPPSKVEHPATTEHP